MKHNNIIRGIAICIVVPDWAAGLPLGADGWVDRFYKKEGEPNERLHR